MEDWEFPVVQWLELCASNAGGTDSVPGWGTKILQAVQKKKKERKKERKKKNRSCDFRVVLGSPSDY